MLDPGRHTWLDAKAALPEVIARLVNAANPVRIILFGSHARGDARPGSDIDLLVVLDHSDNLRRSAITLQNALSGVVVPVDIVVATPALLAKYRDFSGYVYKSALAEGVIAYERR